MFNRNKTQQQYLSEYLPYSFEEIFEYAQGGIHIDPSKKGTFKAQATRMDMGVQEAAAHILANKEDYSPAMVKKANFARNFAKEYGGEPQNPGFQALPEYVQEKILDNMAYGGGYDLADYKEGGYTVRRTDDRKGKTHVVIGPDGTKKYFGDPKMGERGKSKLGKEAFYARHADNLKKNPYFRAYARATWEEGGEIEEYGKGGEMIKRADGSYSRRGLWDNIRANAGSGKKPTKEMLEQERKIKSKQQEGGEQQEQIMQIVQMFAQLSGMQPEQVINELKKLKPEEQQAALEQMVEQVQSAMQQQQSEQPAEEEMAIGGPTRYRDFANNAYNRNAMSMIDMMDPSKSSLPYLGMMNNKVGAVANILGGLGSLTGLGLAAFGKRADNPYEQQVKQTAKQAANINPNLNIKQGNVANTYFKPQMNATFQKYGMQQPNAMFKKYSYNLPNDYDFLNNFQFANGGSLPKAQVGKNIRVQNADGTISVMNTDSPEYREMYQSGMVQHPSAGQGDNPYWGGVLDEVSVTRAPREKGFWEKYRDKIVEENKDAGFFGAILGTPISAVTSLPQLAATYALTDKMQRPSEALDIQNPYGAFVVDAVADPANWFGGGLLDDATNFTGKARNLFRKGLTKGTSNAEKPNIIGQLKNDFAKFNPLNIKSKSGLDWIKKWYSDPEFIKRYNVTGEYTPEIMQEHILEMLNEYEPKNYFDLLKDKGLKKYLEFGPTSGGVSYGTPNAIYMNRGMYAPFNKKGFESVRAHELTHLLEGNGLHLSDLDKQALLKPFGYSNVHEIPTDTGFLKQLLGDNPQYYLDPTEIHARMNQARFDLGLLPKDKFTLEMFDKISKNKNWYGMNRYIKDKQAFVDLMNQFWAVAPVVGGGYSGYKGLQGAETDLQENKQGGSLPKAQVGKEWKLPFSLNTTGNYADYARTPNAGYQYDIFTPLHEVLKKLNINPQFGNAHNRVVNNNSLRLNSQKAGMIGLTALSGINRGLSQFADSAQQRRLDNFTRDNLNTIAGNPINNPSPFGDNLTNVQAGAPQLKPNTYVPIQDIGTSMYAMNGGQYQAGGEYRVSEDELIQLMRDGAEIEFLE